MATLRKTQDKIEASAARSEPSDAFADCWRNTRRDQVREALKTLPPEQFKIMDLAYFSGYTHVEIARLLNLPLGTVKGRLRLGLRKMRSLPVWETARWLASRASEDASAAGITRYEVEQ
jgi:RNA polymerase sigma-70 factor (ECF subfamily)